MVDLIYVFQGISGRHIKFDARSESYLLDPSLKLNSTVRDTVLCICELGWLYNRVAGYLKSSFAVSTDSNGVVVQAFGFALQRNFTTITACWPCWSKNYNVSPFPHRMLPLALR